MWLVTAITILCTIASVTPVLSHHSFAMYDQDKTVVLTGVVKGFSAQANHAEIHFYLIAPIARDWRKARTENQ
jgi:hypothetical protein